MRPFPARLRSLPSTRWRPLGDTAMKRAGRPPFGVASPTQPARLWLGATFAGLLLTAAATCPAPQAQGQAQGQTPVPVRGQVPAQAQAQAQAPAQAQVPTQAHAPAQAQVPAQAPSPPPDSTTWSLQLRFQRETRAGANVFHTLHRVESWSPRETAVIVCDVWDYHHCRRAVDRLEQFGPRLNQLLTRARAAGATIIHSPSDCMPAYEGHPARRRAQAAPAAKTAPPDVALWCSRIAAEERGTYPIDQADGGEDDEPQQHAAWAAKLAALGRNPNLPWQRQSEMIAIDAERDFLSDRGDEVWNVLESRGIRHVILTGVHTNMCVLGRPFGLRQMARGGKNVVLVRDMTDCMYNPARWPYVSHYAGNDLVLGHVERFVCPTITSDQILGGQPFAFAEDRRPRLAVVVAEDGYGAEEFLAAFAVEQWLSRFRVTFIHGDASDRANLPGLEALDQADIAVVYARRRALRPEQLARIRRFVQAGKPIVGLRTASHAFALRDMPVPAGTETWPEFAVEVFGGAYRDHPAGEATARLECATAASDHPITRGGPAPVAWDRPGTLYRFEPLAQGTTPLWVGTQAGQPTEPVAWVYARPDGGRSFYTSLGERADFAHPAFVRLLTRAVEWAAGLEPSEPRPARSPRADYQQHWTSVAIPASLADATGGVLNDYQGPAWFRAVIRTPTTAQAFPVTLELPPAAADAQVWLNGRPLAAAAAAEQRVFPIAAADVTLGDANLLVIRLPEAAANGGLVSAPRLRFPRQPAGTPPVEPTGKAADGAARGTGSSQPDGSAPPLSRPELAGRWQLRIGDDPTWSNMPLPAKFGAPTDIIFEPWIRR